MPGPSGPWYTGGVTREQQLETVREILSEERFAVFAFAGREAQDPPYSSVMFFAQTSDLELVFGTSPGTAKGDYLRTGNGACAQVDTRDQGLEHMARFVRIAVQGRLREVEPGPERERLHGIYFSKLPHAKPLMNRPGVLTYVVEPLRIVFARGMAERFELDFPPSNA